MNEKCVVVKITPSYLQGTFINIVDSHNCDQCENDLYRLTTFFTKVSIIIRLGYVSLRNFLIVLPQFPQSPPKIVVEGAGGSLSPSKGAFSPSLGAPAFFGVAACARFD